MNNNYFAYHGPQNTEIFDYKGGYGVANKTKWNNVNNGDLVYIIQHLKKKATFEFCGIYQVKSHYKNDNPESKVHYRFELDDLTKLDNPIEINEKTCSKQLPLKTSNPKWSNFKNHFCVQGGTFRIKLDEKVVKVLENMLPEKTTFQFAEEIPASEENLFSEGAKQKIIINRYERDTQARNECIKFYGYTCKVCGFDFEKTYGILGKKFIHVHHLTPVSDIKKEYLVNPKIDLIPVCPNCHAMLHRSEYPNDITKLKEVLKQ